MRKQTFGKKLLALSLSVTMLLSCMVWSGVSAAATTYTCDFTGYTRNSTQHWNDVSGYTDANESDSAKAQVISTDDVAHGQVMQLTYTDNAPKDKVAGLLGFRFFAGTGADSDKVGVNTGVCVKVEFSYKVQKLMAPAELRVLAGSASWYTPVINSGEASGANHWATAVALDTTDTPGEWQKATVIVYGERDSSGVHIYMRTDSPTAQGGSSVLIDDVSVTTEYVPSTVTFDYGYDGKTETVLGVDGEAVVFPADPERAFWTFKGWNTQADGLGEWVTAATVNGSATYYAIWEEEAGTALIQFVTNGGDAIDDLAGESGAAATLPTPTRGVYTFLGWYTDPELTTPAADVTFPTAGSTVTLYAKWSDPEPLAAASTPSGVLLGTQTFENATLSDFVTNANDTGKFDGVVTEESLNGTSSLKAIINDEWNSQRGRPRIVIKLDGQSGNLAVKEGGSYAVSFWVKTSIKDTMFSFYAATMGSSDMGTQISNIASGAACHTLQAITATVGSQEVDIYNGNEVNASTIEADQWTQVVITIPSLTLDAADETNYLALGFTTNLSQPKYADTWEPTAYYIDDVAVYKVMEENALGDTSGLALYSKGGSAVYEKTLSDSSTAQRTSFQPGATYVTDSDDLSTVVLDGVSFDIVERGILVGNADATLTKDSYRWHSVRTSEQGLDSCWAYDEETGTVTFTLYMFNASRNFAEKDYTRRAYLTIRDGNGTEHTVYTTQETFNLQTIATENGLGWFSE